MIGLRNSMNVNKAREVEYDMHKNFFQNILDKFEIVHANISQMRLQTKVEKKNFKLI